MAKDWIQKSIKHPGAFTRKAKAAGMSVHEYALKERHAKGVLGAEAREALTLEKIHHHVKKS